MTELPEGFVRHDGGPCPVPLDSHPAVMFPSGRIHDDGLYSAATYVGGGALELPDLWQWKGHPQNNIIAYRPVSVGGEHA